MADISIIIPVYNTEKYIEECLEAVCHSTIFDICEVIIINDGSTDHSMNKIQKYIETYENIFVFSYENAGLSCARNRGVAQAKGKYVFFLDSDDYIKEDYIEKLYKAIQKENATLSLRDLQK